MRRILLASAVAAAVLCTALPANAAPAKEIVPADGWEPAPPVPDYFWDAGTRCDFPVRSTAVLDEVVQKVIRRHPDGKPSLVAYRGPLLVRITNTVAAKSHVVDAGGSALVEYRPDGSQMWHIVGPVLTTFRENGGTLPRGLYRLDGVYTLDIDATGYKILDMPLGSADPLCPRIT
ncbi:hypothetical protein [Yinghuangia soli]|uniref:Uncharacterized protein n=1 Tax=Yinghuangia soli TaxID=2908204 RepID=A0AA41U154_9ACTN|nr:hypothetical protein [Yinghuangia soli]MCF2529185.1 hypothetical protein [Yinghuangia soli]